MNTLIRTGEIRFNVNRRRYDGDLKIKEKVEDNIRYLK